MKQYRKFVRVSEVQSEERRDGPRNRLAASNSDVESGLSTPHRAGCLLRTMVRPRHEERAPRHKWTDEDGRRLATLFEKASFAV